MKETSGAPALDSFDAEVRRAALAEEARTGAFPAEGGNVNMHVHSFHSFNAEGWSPAHAALRARGAGLYAAALCDFDVLDGMEEFLAAGRLLGLRTAVHLETRATLRELANVDINSPGEPGVTYMMGAGFVRLPPERSADAETLAAFRAQARRRNEELVARINAALAAEAAVDYARDVLPLTPGGNATERHIIRAYISRAASAFPDAGALAGFWARVLGADALRARSLMEDPPALEEQARSRLARRGGLAYEPPTERTFPVVDDFVRWVAACRAIPMYAFLDGSSGGEADPESLLGLLAAKGVAAVNIIPDRNWRLKDPAQAAGKRAALARFVAVADGLGLPINIGTEMNRRGQPFSDDLSGSALAAYAEPFRRGARIMVGHSVLLRCADLGYVDARARDECGSLAARNRLFEQVGALPPLGEAAADALLALGPERAYGRIRDSVSSGRWIA